MKINCKYCGKELTDIPPVTIIPFSNRVDSDINKENWEKELSERYKLYFCKDNCFEKFYFGLSLLSNKEDINYLVQIMDVESSTGVLKELLHSHQRQRNMLEFTSKLFDSFPNWLIILFKKTIWRKFYVK